MPIEFRCTDCGKLLRTGDGTAGQQAKCPECGAVMQIPVPELPVSPPPGPAVPREPPAASPFATSIPPPAEPTDAENPYQSPADYQALPSHAVYPGFSDLRTYALARVSGPAIALIVTGALGLVGQLVGIVLQVVLLSIDGPAAGQNPQPMMMMSGGMNLFFGVIGFVLAILVIVGGAKMKKLQSRGLAMTSAIVAMIPCISPCCLLGLPFGIWALVVLSDGQVQAAFAAAQAAE